MVLLPKTLSFENIFFLRHGVAGHFGDPKYKNASLRPLTAQGREKMRYAAGGMKNLNLSFDVILSSPYVRARQTAEIVAKTYRLKKNAVQFSDNLLGPATVEKLLREVFKRFPKSKNILLVGHEPHLTEMVSSLLNGGKPLDIDFKKGSLCCLSVYEGRAVLNYLLTSTQLGLMVRLPKVK